ncbi:MAG: hypothetical protein A2023_03405 [Sulfuricurvum sp. GWF2_44_89]|uniref:STAS domain-containing protein n=1 Tax=Sulfuricurvum kujiense TaxID=148813 RepID=A0A2D3WD77_9BACT|nr:MULTISPECIES: hypothetical protein [Sulfuricurvum]OHD79154.1 MAG: hypothetical protein A2023_03405 [Sulfuricurvum sp. GWF2_44_89]OHD93490.1 MAG: hypothetical protein A2517_09970 [Sulfuricurvum sp. RIFOXYD12_FULL_44_77]OHD99353.1 MAG: hypothetical protein A2552_02525 [Sulfuricurvum sp. RIFOXYD2_FULL_44_160]DAB39251.1 MAG TPA: hypothetical protein CFH83_01655 [Sulfuricurvum kujiense]
MEFDGDALTIDLSMSMEEIKEFEAFVRPRIDYIDRIEVEESGVLKSSALLALLASLKKTRRELSIPFLEKGITTSAAYGTIHWICHD